MKPRHSLRRAAAVLDRRLPLESVRVFESVVRCGSTVAAAAELGLTHGAVSRRVRALEEHLGAVLFGRGRGGRLTPTELGERFATATGDALRLLAEAAAAASAGTRQKDVVRVSTTSSIASLWLIPRLQHFRARHPAFQVWVSETKALVEPGPASGVDFALRAGRGGWPGVRAEPLMDDALVALCSPALAKKLSVPGDLATVPLLHDEDPNIAWPRWTEAAGLRRPAWATRGVRMTGVALLLQAASAGEGAALVPERLAASYLRDGKLVAPFDRRVRLGTAYWLVRPARGSLSSAARAFSVWLHAQARAPSRRA